ncbi:hypothetical protein L7F22_068375 [Adiantum nelumboides]|nr:hypothetical protein [Adiantum nelumboides]
MACIFSITAIREEEENRDNERQGGKTRSMKGRRSGFVAQDRQQRRSKARRLTGGLLFGMVQQTILTQTPMPKPKPGLARQAHLASPSFHDLPAICLGVRGHGGMSCGLSGACTTTSGGVCRS